MINSEWEEIVPLKYKNYYRDEENNCYFMFVKKNWVLKEKGYRDVNWNEYFWMNAERLEKKLGINDNSSD